MGTFYVLCTRMSDSSNIVGASVDISWTSGSGVDLGTDHYDTDAYGRAEVATPKIFIIPTGATGRIKAQKGTLYAEAVAQVDVWGNTDDIVLRLVPDTTGVLKTDLRDILTTGGKRLGQAGIVIAVIVVGIAVAAVAFWRSRIRV